MATADVPPKRLRMAAVEDHPIVVEGLVSLLTRGPEGSRARPDTPAVEWLGQTRTFAELRARIDQWPAAPDLVLFDLNLGDGTDPAAPSSRCRSRAPTSPAWCPPPPSPCPA